MAGEARSCLAGRLSGDAGALRILTRCAEAAGAGGCIVVIGGVSPDATPGALEPESVLVGGRGRTVDELRALAASAGLNVVGQWRQPAGRFVVELRHGRGQEP